MQTYVLRDFSARGTLHSSEGTLCSSEVTLWDNSWVLMVRAESIPVAFPQTPPVPCQLSPLSSLLCVPEVAIERGHELRATAVLPSAPWNHCLLWNVLAIQLKN